MIRELVIWSSTGDPILNSCPKLSDTIMHLIPSSHHCECLLCSSTAGCGWSSLSFSGCQNLGISTFSITTDTPFP